MEKSAGSQGHALMSAPIRVLGPLEIDGEAGVVRIPSGRQEVILAVLVLNLNRVVETDYLVDAVWPQDPPETARTQIHICISRLRKALSAGGTSAAILTRAQGYVVCASEDATDIGMFRRLVGEARELVRTGRKQTAVEFLRAAEQLWRGRCLTGVSSEVLARVAARLDESRLEALETCLRLELDLGRHADLVSRLRQLVADYPLRERFWAHLMLALHRSGRQAEALEAYRQARGVLAEELGLDPGRELRDLMEAILADDSTLAIDSELSEPPPVGAEQSDPTHERVSGPEPFTAPRQLPLKVGDLVTDDKVVQPIRDAVIEGQPRGVPSVVLVLGGPGVGKSTIAGHVAHLVIDHFPDGQLYCDLRGLGDEPVDPGQALERFLRVMGVRGQDVPELLDERAEMYRSLLADRRVLVLLDDARDESQVAPLLPGPGGSALLVTSRGRLTTLPATRGFELEPLGTEQSVQLLGCVIGERRVADEPEAARVLVGLVGGLPLSLRITAARLSARPHWSLASMCHRLQDEHGRAGRTGTQ